MRLTTPLIALGLSACVPSTETYHLQSAALPQAPKPVAQSNLPMRGSYQVFADSSHMVSLQAPEDADRSVEHGIRIPRLELSTGIRWKRTEHFDMAFLFDYGSHANANRVEGDRLPATGDYWGLGGGFNIHLGNASDDLRVSMHASLSLMTVPYVRHETTADGMLLKRTESEDTDPVYRLGLTPSYKLNDAVVAYGGIRLASHVTTLGNGPVRSQDGVPSPVVTESVDASVSVGLDAHLSDGLIAGAYLHQTLLSDDIRYWPTLGIRLAYEWDGEQPQAQAQLPPPYPPH